MISSDKTRGSLLHRLKLVNVILMMRSPGAISVLKSRADKDFITGFFDRNRTAVEIFTEEGQGGVGL